MKKVIFIFFVTLFIFCCKSTDPKDGGDPKDPKTNSVDERAVFVVDEKKLNDDSLKERIKSLFVSIEEKIAKADFDNWYLSISDNYKKYINDKNELKKMSHQSDFLLNRGITLEGPKDYFLYVVIRAREGKILKYHNFEYIDKFHIKVICILDDKNKFDYNFVYEENAWKLDR